MSLPQPPERLLHHLPNGKAVCFDHHNRRCDICCVDYAYEDSDEDEPWFYSAGGPGYEAAFDRGPDSEEEEEDDDDDDEEEDDEEEEEDDRVFVLVGSTARFIPQWDGQLHGPANVLKFQKDYASSPKPLPLSGVPRYYCSTCQLTWLVGKEEESAKSHPSHHCLQHIYAGTSRSLIVFTDGACSGNGLPGARAGLGVFFGPGSKFNFAERLIIPGVPTNQKAEIEAVIRAMQKIRANVLPTRRDIVTSSKGGHEPRAVRDVMHMRLIIVTDSSYIVECMCKHAENWKENEQSVLVNKDGKTVENSSSFSRLRCEVEMLSMVGVQVEYYHVRREDNKDADSLAKGSM